MPLSTLNHSAPIQPVRALLAAERPGVLALIIGIEGPSYRPLGAMMAVFDDKSRIGSLSSGCIEADITLHAREALAEGQPRRLRYGRGSPFRDIELPCGGGLDVLLLPRPDKATLSALARRHEARIAATLRIEPDTGTLSLAEAGATGPRDELFQLHIAPELRILTFGKGPEAATFAALVQTLGHPNVLLSPDGETLDTGTQANCETRHLTAPVFPADLAVDDRTAVVLFFHDHDWEPPILARALATPACYIGAQGSRRARDARLAKLRGMGLAEASLNRLNGPIGLIPSARDAGTLAVSVLAEILAQGGAGSGSIGAIR